MYREVIGRVDADHHVGDVLLPRDVSRENPEAANDILVPHIAYLKTRESITVFFRANISGS